MKRRRGYYVMDKNEDAGNVAKSGSVPERREWDRCGGNYPDTGRNLHLYIEYIEGEKFPKNKLYTRYTQEHGQLKLSKKGK